MSLAEPRSASHAGRRAPGTRLAALLFPLLCPVRSPPGLVVVRPLLLRCPAQQDGLDARGGSRHPPAPRVRPRGGDLSPPSPSNTPRAERPSSLPPPDSDPGPVALLPLFPPPPRPAPPFTDCAAPRPDAQLAFRSAQSLLALKKDHIRRILHLPPPPPPATADSKDPAGTVSPSPASAAAQELEQQVSAYLRRTVDTFDLTKSIDVSKSSMQPLATRGFESKVFSPRSVILNLPFLSSAQEVCSQIWATLYDYPSLKSCTGLLQYVRDSVRLAWALVNQVSRCPR